MVSFDVTNLFPSVPIDIAVDALENWLVSLNLNDKIINEYVKLTNLVMNQNFFVFQGKFFKQEFGTAMGNSLSPFIANLFMTLFENTCKNTFSYFPDVYLRYVDDIFAIFDTKKYDLNQFLCDLNSLFPSIKFTHETENNGQLPFLDLQLTRDGNRITFDIYRKPTHTNNYIHQNSFVHYSNKLASFHSLIHRLVNIPLDKNNFRKELAYIKQIAKQNGFDELVVDNILKKHKFKTLLKNSTTLTNDQPTRYIKIPYHPQITKGLSKIFKTVNAKIAHSNNNKLKDYLNNTKDKIDKTNKSGIYQVSCTSCDLSYIGQTRRNIKTRFKEHMAHFKYNRPEKSSIAQHMIETGHEITENNLKLLKETPNHLLDAYESLYIHKYRENSLNSDKGPIPHSSLFKILD
jgi:hypothetical protein